MALGKTITTYLVDGNPMGIKSVFISNRLCNCIAIPRINIKDADSRIELTWPSLYLLLGEEKKIYIGETENFKKRIKEHNNKDFWNEALVFVAKDESLTKTHVQLLEHLAFDLVSQNNLYNLEENKQVPNKPNSPEHLHDPVLEYFEDVKILTSFLGYPIFETPQSNDKNLFYCKSGKGTDARAIYGAKSIRVLTGSKIRKDTVASYKSCGSPEIRKATLKESAGENYNFYELIKDIEFPTPSAASSFCLGRPSNGRKDWKDKDGKTLEEIFKS